MEPENNPSIIDLCRALPNPEAEKAIRARWVEFTEQLSALVLLQKPALHPVGVYAYQDQIEDAKFATNEMAARGLRLISEWDGKIWMATLYNNKKNGLFITVKASTEPLARAACSLLAGHAMKQAVLGNPTA